MMVNKAAFNSGIEPKLVSDLLADPSAKPLLSLVAIKDDMIVGSRIVYEVFNGPQCRHIDLYPCTGLGAST